MRAIRVRSGGAGTRRRVPTIAVLAIGVLALALGWSCGAPGGESPGTNGSEAETRATTMAIDAGPLDGEAAEAGAEVFQAKGCNACHAFGQRVTGPDLAGVTRRRTRDWLEDMLHRPEVMVREDETARELLATYLVAMPNLSLTDDEVHELIEYMKAQDGSGAAGEED